MTVRDLQGLFAYGYWANQRLFKVLSQLSAEEFTRPVAGSYGSVRNTLVHILSAEWGWLERCGGTRRGPALDAAAYSTMESLVDAWGRVQEYMRAFLSELRDEDLGRTIRFAIGNGPQQAMRVGELIQHAVIHGVHHRGQVALLIRMLGLAPGNFDLLIYYGEANAASAKGHST